MLITKKLKTIIIGASLLAFASAQPNLYAANSFWGNVKASLKLGAGLCCAPASALAGAVLSGLLLQGVTEPHADRRDAMALVFVPIIMAATIFAMKYSLKGIKQGYNELTTDEAA